jgi:hypothetical protein
VRPTSGYDAIGCIEDEKPVRLSLPGPPRVVIWQDATLLHHLRLMRLDPWRRSAQDRFETVKMPAPTACKEAAMGVEHVAIGEGGLRLQGVETLATMAAENWCS